MNPFRILASLSVLAVVSTASAQSSPPPRGDAPPGPATVRRPAALPPQSPAQAPSAAPQVARQTVGTPAPDKVDRLQTFSFEGADLDTVMTMYGEWTGKIYLKTDDVKATITLKANKLTTAESIKVVEAILAMNRIALVPMGEKYVKVVKADQPDLTGQGLEIGLDPDAQYAGGNNFVTQIIPLQNVSIPEVQAAIQHVMHAYGKIMALERSNCLMVTDTADNIRRIRELVDFIDQATARIESRIYRIKYAEATAVAAKLNEVVTAAQADQPKTASSPVGNPAARTPPGVIRARAAKKSASPTQATISKTEGGNPAIIQGTVKVLADERTNLIIIFSQPENFEFFEKIIKELDVEVEPAVTFEVVHLEYAEATDLAGTLNDLVGAASGSRRSSSSSKSKSNSSSRSSSRNARSSSSRSRSGTRVTPRASAIDDPTTFENLSKLSENTKILSDERSNSILLMGRKSDIAAIKKVIASLDVMLEQVLIEAAIFEVTLGDELEYGLQWLYKSDNLDKIGSWDGARLITNAIQNVASGALTYYQNVHGINTEVAIKLAAGDSNVRLLATPVIMTTDNTEAKLSIGEQRPIITSTDSYGNSSGTLRSSYDYKDIGIQLTVTPHINPQRVVVMEINQKADQVGDEIIINDTPVPVILNREFDASIAVPDRGTVALGGLINNEVRDGRTKIPILGDIPLVGRLLFSSVAKKNRRTELIVLMTPYVLANQSEAINEAARIYDATDMQPEDWPKKGWSDSELQYRAKPEIAE